MSATMRARAALRGPVLTAGGAVVAAQLMMAASGVLAARPLGAEGKGVVAAVTIWITLMPWLALAGLHTSLSVRVGGSRASVTSALGSAAAYAACVGGVLAVAAVLVVPDVLAHHGDTAATYAVPLLAAIPLIILTELLRTIQVALGNVRAFAISHLANAGVLLGGMLAGLAAGAIEVAYVLLVTLAAILVAFATAAASLPWRRMALHARELIADMRFGLAVAPAAWLGLANVRIDLLVMSTFVAADEIGRYSLANNLMLPIGTVASVAMAFIAPQVAREVADRRDGAGAAFARIREEARRQLALGAVAALPLAALTPLLVPVVFGESFEATDVLVWILIPGFVLRGYAGVVAGGASGLRRPLVGNAIEGAGFAVTVALLPLLLPPFEALGAAIASSIAYAASAVVAFVALRTGFFGRGAGTARPAAPARRPGSRLRVVGVTNVAPLPPDNGGALRVAGLARELARRHDLTLLVARAADRPELVAELRDALGVEAEVLGIERHGRPLAARAALWLRGVASGVPPWVLARRMPAVTRRVRELSRDADVVVLLDDYAGAYARAVAAGTPIVADKHNVLGASAADPALRPAGPLGGLRFRLSLSLIRRFERRYTARCAQVVVTSDEERARFAALYGGREPAVVPSAIDLPAFVPGERRPAGVAGWIGSLRERVIADGIVRFAREGWPRVSPAGARLLVAGAGDHLLPEDVCAAPGVEVVGYVEDAEAFLASLTVGVVPVWGGAGVKLKTLQMLGSGLPVAASPAAVEGLPVEHGVTCLVGESPEELAEHVERLLGDPELRERLAEAGRRLVAGGFTWDRVAGTFAEVVEEAGAGGREQPAPLAAEASMVQTAN